MYGVVCLKGGKIMNIQEQVADITKQAAQKLRQNGKLENVVWVAAGGSFGGFYPAQYFMDHESVKVTSESFTSNEFALNIPKYVGNNTLAIFCSMRGTKETCVAAKKAKAAGATVIALYVLESDLTKISDFNIKYESIAEDTSRTEHVNSSIGLMLAMNIVNETEDYPNYKEAMHGFEIVDAIYRRAVKVTKPLAQKWAQQNADRNPIYVMGSGPTYGAAYIFSICNIEEMLQIASPTINSCEFFHGPFEVLDKSTSVFQLISVGRLRAADERAVRFLKQYGGDKVYLLDGKEIGLNDLDDSISEYFNHILFAPILNNVYMRALSKVTSKDYNTRRYMWKVAY